MISLSHTSMERWRACPQRWAYGYVYGIPWKILDPMGAWATYSRSVVHPALGALYLEQEPQWETYWEIYQEETPGPEKLKWGETLTLAGAKQIADRMRPFVEGDLREYQVEQAEGVYHLGISETAVYLSIPDVVLVQKQNPGKRVVIDFKLSSQKEKSREDLPFHDQFVGQATLAQCGEVWPTRIYLAKERGKLLVDVVRLPLHISEEHKEQWLQGMIIEASGIAVQKQLDLWPKHSPGACFSWGRACPALSLCSAPTSIRGELIQRWLKREEVGEQSRIPQKIEPNHSDPPKGEEEIPEGAPADEKRRVGTTSA